MIKEYWEEIYKKEKLVKTKKGTGGIGGLPDIALKPTVQMSPPLS